MKLLGILRIICLAFSTVTAVEAAAQDLSGYCQTGSVAALQGGDQKALATIRTKCKPGDTLIIPGASTFITARVCDFSKSVVVVAGNIICVHDAERPIW